MQKKHVLFPFTKLHFLLVYASLSALGCLKWGDSPKKIPPSGQVLEYGTMKPIPNALVLLYECQGEGLGNFGCSVVDSMRSSADGKYTFSSTGFQVDAYKQGYFTDYMTAVGVLSGSEDKCNIILSPHAWLRVNIRNESGAYLISVPGATSTDTERAISLEQGQDSTFTIFRDGNQDYDYVFAVIPVEGMPSTKDPNAFKISSNGVIITPTWENSSAPWFPIYLPGHDTTNLTIIY
jgi:hypothetical protein